MSQGFPGAHVTPCFRFLKPCLTVLFLTRFDRILWVSSRVGVFYDFLTGFVSSSFAAMRISSLCDVFSHTS